MALPQANPTGAMTPQMQQYQAFTMKEAITTAMTAAKYQFTSNLISKLPILRNIPGSGILRERAELKKRELYEKQGRDETGRKLTKSEFEERQKRKQDVGKLAEIKDILQSFLDSGVGVFTVKNPKGKMDSGGQMVVSSSGGGAYAIEGEEQAEEREREDDQDQLESEGRQQKFFTRLFGGRNREEGDSTGIIGTLLGWLGSLGSLFTGGLTGFLGTLFGPIMSIMGTMMTSVMGFITPLVAAVGPILVAALPATLGLLMGGAAGVLIANWINKWGDEYRDKADRETKEKMEQGSAIKTARTATGEKIYRISDKDGNTKFGTVAELGLNQQQLQAIEKEGFADTDQGRVGEATYRVETKAGKETGKLATGLSGNEILAVEMARGEMTIAEASSKTSGEKKMIELERSMAEYSQDFSEAVANSTDDSLKALSLRDNFNSILQNTKRAINKYPEVFTSERLRSLVMKYGLFSNAIVDGKVRDDSFAYIDKDTGFIGMQSSTWDYLDSDDLVLPGKGTFTFGSRSSTAADWSKRAKDAGVVNRINPETMTPKIPTSTSIPTMSDENAALKEMPTPAPVSINTSASSSTTTNNAVVANAPSAQKTGADQTPKFNGSN